MPYKIAKIHFDKVNFDQDGVYNMSTYSTSKEFQIRLNYIFSDISNSILDAEKNLPIPIAPCIPTKEEIKAIQIYINRKYPLLLRNSPKAIETSINRSKEIHNEEIKIFKESHRKNNWY